MQATTRTQTGADVAPAKVPSVTVYTSGDRAEVLKIPKNRDEMRALLARRREISLQLNSVTERRNNLIQQLRTVPNPEGAAGIRSQLSFLDARVLQLESDLATVGQEVAASSPQLIAMAQESVNPPTEDTFGAGVAVGSVTIFFLMSAFVFFWRRRWTTSGRSAPMLPAADSERLQRLENGMEAMAIEIERVSEGQRFVTKLLTESRAVEPAPR